MLQMNDVCVYIKGGEICISQSFGPDSTDVINLTPEQIPLVCKWLMKVASEVQERLDANLSAKANEKQ